jgi:hypothetical protein
VLAAQQAPQPAWEPVLTAHGVQSLAAVVDRKVPAGQAVHWLAPADEAKVPMGQGMQAPPLQ